MSPGYGVDSRTQACLLNSGWQAWLYTTMNTVVKPNIEVSSALPKLTIGDTDLFGIYKALDLRLVRS